jgi:hypothetical protein
VNGFEDSEMHTALEDERMSGQPSNASNSETVAKVCEMVVRECQITTKLMVDQLYINQHTHQILHEYL